MGTGDDYEVLVGLWFNREREQVRWALPVSVGIGLALGGGNDGIYEALTDTTSQATTLKEHQAAQQKEFDSSPREVKKIR